MLSTRLQQDLCEICDIRTYLIRIVNNSGLKWLRVSPVKLTRADQAASILFFIKSKSVLICLSNAEHETDKIAWLGSVDDSALIG